MDVEVDEDLLSVFALTWHDTPDHIATPPPGAASHQYHHQHQQTLISSSSHGQHQQQHPYQGFSPPLTRSAAAAANNLEHREESRDDIDVDDNANDDTADLKWMNWDHDHDDDDDDYNDLDASPVSIFRKKMAAAMVEGDSVVEDVDSMGSTMTTIQREQATHHE
jgi:hypothetical protein